MITLIRNVKNLFLISVAESVIVSVVKELSFKKSTDYIGLNMEIIKHVMPFLANPLCYISNKSLFYIRFLDIKIAKIMPLCMSGDINLICNYRPISFLPQLSKIF